MLVKRNCPGDPGNQLKGYAQDQPFGSAGQQLGSENPPQAGLDQVRGDNGAVPELPSSGQQGDQEDDPPASRAGADMKVPNVSETSSGWPSFPERVPTKTARSTARARTTPAPTHGARVVLSLSSSADRQRPRPAQSSTLLSRSP